jgi:protein-disulfide isomerase
MSALKTPVSGKDQQTGHPGAPVTLVEYGDYQCRHCGIAYPFIKRLLAEKEKDLLFVFRNFPLQEAHPAAYMAALAAEAAGSQGKFWLMHDMIFEHQDNLHGNSFIDFAAALDLDMQQFAQDWRSEAVKQKVEADFESGIRSGVNGTPTFFLNGEKVAYDETYESLLQAVEAVIPQQR